MGRAWLASGIGWHGSRYDGAPGSSVTLIAGYEVETLAMDGELVLSRSLGAEAVLILSTSTTAANPQRLLHAWALRDDLDPAWATRPRELLQHAGGLALVLEDPGGELLALRRGGPWEVAPLLRVGIGLASAIGRLHARGLLHKDIKPTNLLADAVTGTVWLTGFGFASKVTRERPGPVDVMAGTLEYMAPEQTGRVNRSIDSRSDLYAVGVTLYQMATGSLPFKASDPMEWIHNHIARQPVPPHERGVPGPISSIIMRLLAKTAEDRYQTAEGLEADLRRCLACWEKAGRIDHFALGARDASDRFAIPEKLYGREREVETLLSAFARVVANGRPEVVFVSGYSGIGKSSVVNELHRVLVDPRGLFASGKYDQFKRDIPYATLAQAFQGLVSHLLGQSEAEVASWRARVMRAVGGNGQLVTNLIPELELIIGKQNPVPDLPPLDAKRRFQDVFARFVGVFARKEHPLVLFLDDLQWLDAATLDLLEHLATDPELSCLLLIGAYRQNEVGPTHPLQTRLAMLRTSATPVEEIALTALGSDDVNRVVSEALHASLERTESLAGLVHERTGGNPFFVIQFLTALVEQRLVAFDQESLRWQWDIERIRAQGFTDNVVELLSSAVDKLPAASQQVLKHFACVGNRASTNLLGMVCGLEEPELHSALRDAVHQGLVFRTERVYAFQHDRVQEAAYALTAERDRAGMHLRIGRMMMASQSPTEIEDNIFEVVNQLDRGASLIQSSEERTHVATLDLAASKRAKRATAYAAALRYLIAGRALLSDADWEGQYSLMMELELGLAECEFLTGSLTTASERLFALSNRARSRIDAAAVTFLQVTVWGALDRPDRAVEVGLAYLRLIGIEWSAHPTREEVQREYDQIWQRLGTRSIESLVDLPMMVDPDRRAILDALTAVMPPAIFTDENLNCLILCRMVNLSLDYGNSDASCFAYVMLGRVLGPYFGDLPAGFRFGKLASDLVKRPDLARYQARVCSVFGNCVNPWSKHIDTSIETSRRALEIAQETGDLTFGAYSSTCLITVLLGAGTPLSDVEHDADRALEFAHRANFGVVMDMVTGQLRLIRALRGLTAQLGSFDDKEFSEANFEQHLEANPALVMATFWYWTRKLQGRYLANDFVGARAAGAKASALTGTSASFYEMAEYHFYSALAQTADMTVGASGNQHDTRLEEVRVHQTQLASWAGNCPENFADRASLIAAEIARVEGRELDAMHLYENAIRTARQHHFAHQEAIASEVAARFYAAQGFETTADAYLSQALDGYRRWGADGKVRQIERRHPHLRQHAEYVPPATAMTAQSESLDLATVMKTSQAVSVQIGIERLLQSLMVIVLQHAGAERGLLILRRDDELWVEAEATTERNEVAVRLRHQLVSPGDLAESVLQYTVRTQEAVLLDDAQVTHPFSSDAYFVTRRSRSVLCLPLVKGTEVIGVLYLENTLTPHVFTPGKIEVLKLLASQAAISLENASLEEKEALLKEVHHRVKNNLQLISSLLSLQASRIKDPAVAELFADSRNRVRSMALVHENLYRAGNFSKIPMATHVQSLGSQLTRAYGLPGQEIELLIDVGDLHLDMNRAVTCGLIINELVSNALKHAFPGGRAGRVQIDLQPLGGGRQLLRVGDNGIGLPPELDFGRADSLGLQLVRDLTHQLHGTVAVRRDGGTTFMITFDEAGREANRG